MAPPTTSPRKKHNKSRKHHAAGDKGHAASQKHSKDTLPTGNETVVSQYDVTHHHSNRSGAGPGGKITQLEKIGQVLNRPAYLSRQSSDIICHIYKNQQGATILHQMVQDCTVAAGNRTPSPRQPDSDGENEVVHHFWDELQDGGEDPP